MQLKSLISSLLPLCIALSACDGAPEEDFHEAVLVDFGSGPTEIMVQNIGGEAVMDGDILLGPIDRVRRGEFKLRSATEDSGKSTRSAISHLNSWPGGRIPYVIDESDFPASHPMRDKIQAAINRWNSETVVRLFPHDHDDWWEHYVTIKGPSDDMSNTEGRSAMGFTPGLPQDIRLGYKVSQRTIEHEIGHTVGLFHEQNRADRDTFVTINWDNVRDDRVGNFYTYVVSGFIGLDFGPYDHDSIMHYSSFAFAKDGKKPTIVRKGCKADSTDRKCRVGPGSTLSVLDKAGVTRQVTGNPLGNFRLRNAGNNRCLRPQGAKREENVPVLLYSCSNTASRRWYTWTRPGTSHPMIINEHTRMCLTRDGNNSLVQRTCNGSASQRFRFESAGWFQGELIRQGSRCAARLSGKSQPVMSTNCPTTGNRRWYKDAL